MMAKTNATYLYCLVSADRQPSLAGAPPGLPGTGALRVLAAGPDLWLVVADAPLARYGSGPVERGLRDLEWVGLRGAAHARVVGHFARRFTTLPLKLFTLFTADDRAVAHVRDDEARVRRLLARVDGRVEWGVRVRLDPGLVRRRARRPSRVKASGGRAGTRFLLAKKRERDVAREVLREGRAAVEDAFEELAALAETTRRRSPAELEGTRLALDAALLVDAERATRLRQTAQRAARALAGHGYRLTMTGPWPAYSFVSDGR